jgi:DNA-binding CsgD family transcriptional regulator
MTMLQEITPHRGRPTSKFTLANIQKIKDWVAEGISREDIAELLGVTVGSLQVTCSRLGISLRIPKMFERPMPQCPRLQIVLEHGGMRRETDVPLTGLDIARLGLEASVQNLGMTQLLTQAVTIAIKKDLIDEILRRPTPQAQPESSLAGGA